MFRDVDLGKEFVAPYNCTRLRNTNCNGLSLSFFAPSGWKGSGWVAMSQGHPAILVSTKGDIDLVDNNYGYVVWVCGTHRFRHITVSCKARTIDVAQKRNY